MNIFTVNQVNQVYVMKTNSTFVSALDSSHQITKSNNLGSAGLGKTADGKSIYFKYLGAGGLTRSDLIDIANIMDIKATPAGNMARTLKAARVTLNSEALSSSKPIAGEDFILRLRFQNPIGMSPDNQYWKYGVVHAVSTTTASQFYLTLASSIAKNMSRDGVQIVKVFVTYGSNFANKTEITSTSDISDSTTFSQTYTGVQIEEVEQDWILGIKQQKPLTFYIEPREINNGDEEVIWGDVVYSNGEKYVGGTVPSKEIVSSYLPSTGATVVNSKLMADYEYFYMGERADQYRLVNWPDYVPTTYLVDPAWQYGYDIVAIHFAYTGANHAVQKSEKDITFIVPRASTDTTAAEVGALAASIKSAIEAAITDTSVVKFSGTLVDGNVPAFDGTTGTIKDSGIAAADLEDSSVAEPGL